MGYCKDCKHKKEDSEYTPFNPVGMIFGDAIFGFPMAMPGFPGSEEDCLKCDNARSIHHGDKVDDYDSCTKFEE
jgi:hypothetical protein